MGQSLHDSSSSSLAGESINETLLNKNVILMRNKFEKFTSQPLAHKPMEGQQAPQSPSAPKVLPIIFQTSSYRNSRTSKDFTRLNSISNTTNASSNESELAISTSTPSLSSEPQNPSQALISPSPSITSSASSPSSSSSSFDPSETMVTRTNYTADSKSPSNNSGSLMDFDFYNEFYTNSSMEQTISVYPDTLRTLIRSFFARNTCVKYLLDPQGQSHSTANENFKFTIDHFKSIMTTTNLRPRQSKHLSDRLAQLQSSPLDDQYVNEYTGESNATSNSNTDSISICENRLLDDSTLVFLMLNVEFDVNMTNLLGCSNTTSVPPNMVTESGGVHSFLSSSSSISSHSCGKDSGVSVHSSSDCVDFDSVKRKLTYLFAKKLDYLNEQMEENLKSIEANHKLGNKVHNKTKQNKKMQKLAK